MYQITFESNGVKISKSANNEDEVRKLVYVYTNLSQKEREIIIGDILAAKNKPLVQEDKPKKSKEDGSNL